MGVCAGPFTNGCMGGCMDGAIDDADTALRLPKAGDMREAPELIITTIITPNL